MATLLDELRVKFTMSQIAKFAICRDVKMQNILLTAKGVLKLGKVTPKDDLSQSEPCLTGETSVDQLALILKLLGSPTLDDLSALSVMGCPDLIQWRREALAFGRPDNLERRFLSASSVGTVTMLRGLLTWHPQARWTAGEALGRGKGKLSVRGEQWWTESPRAIKPELLPTYPEVRNGTSLHGLQHRGKDANVEVAQAGLGASRSQAGTYVFDFEDERTVHRPSKRPRAR
ncbi:MAG: hypothetical protein L6R37_002279 [Teloschistes peruensis]|nr:MAG: hypothetical protein L6R37_002279 [Teloschistes peruensis]